MYFLCLRKSSAQVGIPEDRHDIAGEDTQSLRNETEIQKVDEGPNSVLHEENAAQVFSQLACCQSPFWSCDE
jgi:hypothetical protein